MVLKRWTDVILWIDSFVSWAERTGLDIFHVKSKLISVLAEDSITCGLLTVAIKYLLSDYSASDDQLMTKAFQACNVVELKFMIRVDMHSLRG
jgi:hypothetical protein